MRFTRYGCTATTHQKIQISAFIGLQHVLDIKLLITTLHGQRRRVPAGTPFSQFLLADVQQVLAPSARGPD